MAGDGHTPNQQSMKARAQILDRILDAIREAKTICVVGHIRPDGDCIGSQLGLTLALRAEGKKVVCWNQDSLPQKYRFLDPDRDVEKPKSGEEFDLVIATDCASFERLGKVGEFITKRKLLINIDHHESNTRYGDVNWISPREPSTGELIHRLLKTARWPITKQIADCLFTAVSTDTGSFQYPSTRPGTFHVGAELVTRGANLAKIADGIRSGSIRTLIVFGEDVTKHGIGGDLLAKLDTLIVSDILPNATTAAAHFVLPGCAHVEKRGTFVNVKGRVQKFMRAVEAPGDARPEWEFLHELVHHVPGQNGFSTIEGLFNQMAREVPGFAGLEWAKLGDTGVTVQI